MTIIPALSVTRPWPTFIASRLKPIENRTWTTSYRGPMWLHAANSWQGAALDFASQLGIEIGSWEKRDYPTGIVALVDLVDICDAHNSRPARGCECGPWAMIGQYHWRIGNVRPLPAPVPCKGALKLWAPPAEVLAAITALGVGVDA